MTRRESGLLLHISSLPSPYGIGDLGPAAHAFVDFLAETKQRVWQVLPLNPTSISTDNGPYRSSSAFGGNPLFISPDLLLEDGLLSKGDMEPVPSFPQSRVDYQEVTAFKERVLHRAWERREKKISSGEYEIFCSENSGWLEDFSLFHAIQKRFPGKPWNEWPPDIRDRNPEALRNARNDLSEDIGKEKFLQFIFFTQWMSVKSHCMRRGIGVIGDISIYVNFDSADIWVHPGQFKLDRTRRPEFVSGVPPDYFSPTGQLWGDPVYRWDVMKETGYSWWLERISHNLRLFDVLRLDHFRGFAGYWEVPAGEENAVNGKWVPGPGADLFGVLTEKFPDRPFIAEDLGVITQDVKDLLSRLAFPGMKVLLFAFDDTYPWNPYLPRHHGENCVVYTGTHDNNTVRGWFEKEATDAVKRRLFDYIGKEVSGEEVHWEMIRLAMASKAFLAVIPVQDLLGLGEEARMNRPHIAKDNWVWRLLPDDLTPSIAHSLREMTEASGRSA